MYKRNHDSALRGVIVRQSSDLQSTSDPDVSQALLDIRSKSNRPIQVIDILKPVPVSRRVLERRFRKCLNPSFLEEIHRTHLERAG